MRHPDLATSLASEEEWRNVRVDKQERLPLSAVPVLQPVHRLLLFELLLQPLVLPAVLL